MLRNIKVRNLNISKMLKRKISRALSSNSNENDAAKALKKDKTESCELPLRNLENLDSDNTFEQKFLNIQLELNSILKPLTFKPPVAYIYNPVEYAYKANESYIKKYCKGPKKLLFVGMNPGPFGMCQTGVPFGEIKSVRDWLNIEEQVDKPENECPERPVLGFASTRSEVSGDRLWNLFKRLCGTPENFFKNCFVYNYCPVALLNKTGGNLTPGDIKDAKELESICDKYYFQIIQHLQPEIIIGIGRYVEKRTVTVLKENSSDIKVLCLLHPSPRVKNNQNWPQTAERFLRDNDLLKYMTE